MSAGSRGFHVWYIIVGLLQDCISCLWKRLQDTDTVGRKCNLAMLFNAWQKYETYFTEKVNEFGNRTEEKMENRIEK